MSSSTLIKTVTFPHFVLTMKKFEEDKTTPDEWIRLKYTLRDIKRTNAERSIKDIFLGIYFGENFSPEWGLTQVLLHQLPGFVKQKERKDKNNNYTYYLYLEPTKDIMEYADDIVAIINNYLYSDEKKSYLQKHLEFYFKVNLIFKNESDDDAVCKALLTLLSEYHAFVKNDIIVTTIRDYAQLAIPSDKRHLQELILRLCYEKSLLQLGETTLMNHFLEQQQQRRSVREKQDAESLERVNSIVNSLLQDS